MAAVRAFPDQTTHPAAISGPALAALQKAEGDALWNGVISQVGSVAGTVDVITGVCTPPLTATPANGQTFRLVPAGDNTTVVTINLDSRGAISLKDEDGGALGAGDIVSGRPIMFWYEAANTRYRLCNPTQADLLAAMAASIASASQWDEVGDTTVGSAVAQVEHLFTAGSYAKLSVIVSGLSAASGAVQFSATLRNASGAIVTILTSNPVSGAASSIGASDILTAEVEFIIDVVSSTKKHFGALKGVLESGSVNALTRIDAVGSSATAPDRIRIAYSSGNIDAGRVITKGLKV